MAQPPQQPQQQPPQPSLQTHFSTLAPSPLCAHLTDSTGHTIMSTSTSARQSHNLLALSHAYLSARDTACRMGLGVPLRVTVQTGAGTAVIQTGSEVTPDKVGGEIVVGTVVGPADRVAEARVASWGVEEVAGRVGRVIGEMRSGSTGDR